MNDYYSKLASAFPDTILTLWIGSQLSRLTGKLPESQERMKRASDLAHASVPNGLPLYRLVKEVGWVNFICLEFQSVADTMTPVAEVGETHLLGGWSCALCGCSYAALGNKAESDRWFDALPDKTCGNAFDKRMCLKGPVLKTRENPFVIVFELLYHLSQLSKSKGADWMKKALALLNGYTYESGQPPTAGEKAVLSLLQGVMFACSGEPENARTALAAVIEWKSELESDSHNSWVLPHAQYELAVVEIRDRNYEQAKTFLDTATNWPTTDFHFSDALAYRCKGAAEQLDKMMANDRTS